MNAVKLKLTRDKFHVWLIRSLSNILLLFENLAATKIRLQELKNKAKDQL